MCQKADIYALVALSIFNWRISLLPINLDVMDIFPWVLVFFPELLVHGFAQIVFLLRPVLDSSLYIFFTPRTLFIGKTSNFEREDASLGRPMCDKTTIIKHLWVVMTHCDGSA